ncbi:hypothetical protein B4N89_36400 [Embleya scabrispora]|uniref:Uncharacterized protein n=1 Tax=Embleya scabrispora TaxID=159449 RepID=A0A1T3NM09_9ACTN|nr:hypothetical protein [Embleya scabrispora]OPC77770.1 hypothetical protein B4N89_36400 [Embleya scabrispora]
MPEESNAATPMSVGAATGSRESESAGVDALARANMVAFAAELVERGCVADGPVDVDAAEEDDEGRAEYRLFAARSIAGKALLIP